MALTTPTFLLFLSIIFAIYWLSKGVRTRNLILLSGSYFFYATWDSRFGVLLLITSLIDYGVGLGLARINHPTRRRMLLLVSLIANLGMLAFFKYFNFFSENLVRLGGLIGWRFDPAIVRIILPIGLSFYTFKSLSYTIDVYRRHYPATNDAIAYLTYVAFFPQLLAGPIDRANNLLRQLLSQRTFNYELAVDGSRQMLWGFVKKLVLADNLAPIVNLVYQEAATRPGPHLFFATVCFAFQIYCDFSAYSDIAIGGGKLLGITSLQNFHYPYFSRSPAEFWRRWHISLMSWFRDYVYFPLGGIRGSAGRRVFNVILTFLLSGLWHGASWNFLVWGGLNGVAVTPGLFLKRKTESNDRVSFKTGAKICITFLFVCLMWVFFRAANLKQAVLILSRIFTDALNLAAYRSLRSLLYPFPEYPLAGKWILIILFAFVLFEWIQRRRPHPLTLDTWPRAVRWLAYQSLIFLMLYFGSYSISQFYYYQF